MRLSIANYITLSRIIGALCLIPLDVTTQVASPFWVVYAFCGITDMTDGYMARKLKAETKAGALLDSVADIVFVICCSCKLVLILEFPSWLWGIILIIAGIKLANQISSWIVHNKLLFLHTTSNKLTGLMMFISIPLYVCFGMFLPLIITSAMAACAAVQEGHYIRIR